MSRSTAPLLLFALTGCLHRSPEAPILAPFVASLAQEPSDQTNQPDYIAFADQLTATVFESLNSNAHYRVTPMGTRLECPANAPPEPHCYLLGARVVMQMGDSAVATIQRTYQTLPPGPTQTIRIGGTIVYEDRYLLLRRSGKWKVEKRLDGSVMIPG
jgi:hypothetical protein